MKICLEPDRFVATVPFEMNAPEITHYMLSKQIRAEAQMRALANAVELLTESSIDELTSRSTSLKPGRRRIGARVKPAHASLLKSIFGRRAVSSYIDSEMAHFEEMFPDDAIFVREHLELSEEVSESVMGRLIVDLVNREQESKLPKQSNLES